MQIPGAKDLSIEIHSFSKTFNMTGWRIGYAGGPAPLISAMKTIQSQSTSNPCSIAQRAAVAALTGSYDSVHEMVHYSRAIKQMEYNAQCCCQCAHLYRDGEVERLLKRVHQLDRKLAVQTLVCQVPIENMDGGSE